MVVARAITALVMMVLSACIAGLTGMFFSEGRILWGQNEKRKAMEHVAKAVCVAILACTLAYVGIGLVDR